MTNCELSAATGHINESELRENAPATEEWLGTEGKHSGDESQSCREADDSICNIINSKNNNDGSASEVLSESSVINVESDSEGVPLKPESIVKIAQ